MYLLIETIKRDGQLGSKPSIQWRKIINKDLNLFCEWVENRHEDLQSVGEGCVLRPNPVQEGTLILNSFPHQIRPIDHPKHRILNVSNVTLFYNKSGYRKE